MSTSSTEVLYLRQELVVALACTALVHRGSYVTRDVLLWFE